MGQQLGCLLVFRLARYSVTPLDSVSATCLSCPFRFQKSWTCVNIVTMHEQLQYWLRQSWVKLWANDRGKGFSHPMIELAWRWQVFRRVSTAWNKVPVMYGMGRIGRPSRNTNLDMILSSLVVWEWRSIYFPGATCENKCYLNTWNAEDKHQSGALLSLPLPDRGF